MGIDSDGDGFINRSELGQYLQRSGLDENLAYKSADQIIQELGNSKTKQINIAGFQEGAVSYDLSDQDNIKKTFESMSQGRSYVTKEDLNVYFHQRVQDDSLSTMLVEIDSNEDGKIDFEEFRQAMHSPLKAEEALKVLAQRRKSTAGSGTGNS